MSKEYKTQCLGKHRHKSLGAAEAQARSLVAVRDADPKDLNMYHCKFCKGWHVGNAQARRRKKTFKRGRGGRESKGD